MYDPLANYHQMLRATRSSGYPGMQMFQPHPYAMFQASLERRSPFTYNQQQPISVPFRQINNRFSPIAHAWNPQGSPYRHSTRGYAPAQQQTRKFYAP